MGIYWLIRHGETEWNRQQVFRGRIDVELNQLGLKQAELLGEHFCQYRVDAVYSSPLKRALETARAIAGPHGLEVQVTDGLVDIDYGRWQGLSWEEVERTYPVLYRRWEETPHLVQMPDGESLEEVRRRAYAALLEILFRHQDQNVAIVSHRVVNKVLICALLGLDNSHFWRIRQDNCGITTFIGDHYRLVLIGHNDLCHLRVAGAEVLKADF